MAIIGKLDVTIRCKGVALKELKEHETEQSKDDPSTKAVYVKAKPQQKFSIIYRVLPGFDFAEADFLSFETYFDGHKYDCPVCEKDDYHILRGCDTSRQGITQGEDDSWVVRDYCFGKLSARLSTLWGFRTNKD